MVGGGSLDAHCVDFSWSRNSDPNVLLSVQKTVLLHVSRIPVPGGRQ